MSREAKPLPCPLHPDVAPMVHSGGYHFEGVWIECSMPNCWHGPLCDNEAEAVARWNEVVGAVTALQLLTGNAERATVQISRAYVPHMGSRTLDGSAVLAFGLEPSGITGLDRLIVTRTESPLPIVAELEAQVAVMREALEGVRALDYIAPTEIARALSTDAGQKAAAVLRAARALVAGMPYTMGAPGDGEHNALWEALDALDGRA